MSPASVTADRVRLQRTWLYARFQRDQVQMTLDGVRTLGLSEFESACRQSITALESVMSDCQEKLAF